MYFVECMLFYIVSALITVVVFVILLHFLFHIVMISNRFLSKNDCKKLNNEVLFFFIYLGLLPGIFIFLYLTVYRQYFPYWDQSYIWLPALIILSFVLSLFHISSLVLYRIAAKRFHKKSLYPPSPYDSCRTYGQPPQNEVSNGQADNDTQSE